MERARDLESNMLAFLRCEDHGMSIQGQNLDKNSVDPEWSFGFSIAPLDDDAAEPPVSVDSTVRWPAAGQINISGACTKD